MLPHQSEMQENTSWQLENENFPNCAQYLHVWPHAWQVLQPDHSISICYIHGYETHCTWHLWSTAVHQWIHVQDRHSKLPAKVNIKAISSILPHFFNSVISDTYLIRGSTQVEYKMLLSYTQSMTLCMSVFLTRVRCKRTLRDSWKMKIFQIAHSIYMYDHMLGRFSSQTTPFQFVIYMGMKHTVPDTSEVQLSTSEFTSKTDIQSYLPKSTLKQFHQFCHTSLTQ